MLMTNKKRFYAVLALACISCDDAAGPEAGSNAIRFQFVDVGEYTSCGLTSDGVAYCWGKNDSGQLGRGDAVSGPELRPVIGDLRFTKISVGDNHACGISTGARTYCWGENKFGQLGHASTTLSRTPVQIASGEAFDRISAGGANTCALRPDGAAYCWGRNEVGTLGTGEVGGEASSPKPVAGGLQFRMVSVGGGHACGVTLDDRAYCWGSGAEGVLGNSSNVPVPAPTPVLGDLSFSVVRAGQFMTCGLTTSGELYCWGFDGSGGLGRGSTYGGSFSRPQRVASSQRYVSLSTGGQHSCAVTAEGLAYCWGWNMYGNLGTGNLDDSYAPVRVAPDLRWTSIEVRFLHSCGVTAAGEAFCWGSETDGELGMKSPPDRCTVGGGVYSCAMKPTRIDSPSQPLGR